MVSSVMTDESFNIPSPLASEAVRTATAMSTYINEDVNREVVNKYSLNLFDMLTGCLSDKYKRSEFQRERMWAKYHQLRTSDLYREFWTQFVGEASVSPASPIFYQYVGNNLFQMLIMECYSIHSYEDDLDILPLTYIETNALRYVAGNVCHSVRKKIINKKHPLKGTLIIAIGDMGEDSDRSTSSTSNWMNMVDRGGLFHISDVTYKFFHCMEMLVRKVFHRNNVRNFNTETKDRLIISILHDEEVTSHWNNLMEEVESDEANVLLKMVVELYITIRGYSFTKTLVEEYKQVAKKTTQKSKSLRKTIESEST